MAGERDYTFFSVDTDTGDDDQNIDALLDGYKWDVSITNVISFSFIDSASDISYDLNPFGGSVAFANEFSDAQKAAARDVLAQFAAVADVVFDEIGDDPGENNADGTLRFADYTGISTAYGYYPFSNEAAGDMAFADGSYEVIDLGTYEYATVLHEVGHAMGLKHGHDTSGSGAMTADKNGMEYSVMTYNSFIGQAQSPGFYTNSYGNYAQTLMMYDIAALQRMYGANWDTNNSDTTYSFSTSTGEMSINGVGQGTPADDVIFRTLWDGGGTDTYDFSNFTNKLAIDLTPGAYSDLDTTGNDLRAQLNAGWDSSGNYVGAPAFEFAAGHLYNALQFEGNAASLIENAIGGSGNDQITGNDATNTLEGGGGNDRLYGLDADDTLKGGDRNDTAFGGRDNDLLQGQRGRDNLYGDGGDDTLEGNNGADKLTGGSGDDVLQGGKGGDQFIFKGSGRNGTDTILDFDDGVDVIRIYGGTSFGDLTISVVGADTQISWNQSLVIVSDVTTGIDAADFLFA